MEAEVLDARTRRQLYAIVDQYKGSKFQPGGIEKWGQTEGAMRSWSRKIRLGVQGSAEEAAASGSGNGPTPVAKRYFRPTSEASAKPATKPDAGRKKLWVLNQD